LVLASNGFYGVDRLLGTIFETDNTFIVKVADWQNHKLWSVKKNGLRLSIKKFFWLLWQTKIEQLATYYPNVKLHTGGDFPKADVLISIGWDRKIPSSVYSKYALACNFHPSLLPNYKGHNPIVRAWKDNAEGGVTLHKITDKFDSGEIIAQKKISFKNKSLRQCYDDCTKTGGELLLKVVPKIYAPFDDSLLNTPGVI